MKCFRFEEEMLRGGYEKVIGKRPRCTARDRT